MKKLLALLLVLAMVLSMAACGKKEETSVPSEGPVPQDTAAPEEVDPDAGLPRYEFTQYGKGTVTIVGSELTQDDYGDDLLRVYYKYTNNDDTAAGHYLATALNFVSITQDGQECMPACASTNDEFIVPADLGSDLYVQPGVTALQTVLIPCDPNGGPVEVSCYLMVGSWVYDPDTTETFDFQVDLKDLTGAPKFEQAPITNPTYTASMSASGPYDYPLDCEVSIDGIELTKDCDGKDLLRVFFTVTNNDEEALAPAQMLIPELYQDGVGLPYADAFWALEEPTDEDLVYEEDLYPGETVECSALFYPRNQNPVELVIESTNAELRLGTAFDLAEVYAAAAAADKAAADAAAAAAAAASAADKALMAEMVGVWDRTNSWEDHITFNADLTGIHDMTGDLYPFTYLVTDGVVTLTYDDGEEVSYEVEVSGNDMLLTDADWGDELTWVRAGAEEPEEEEPEETEATEAAEPTLEELIIGTWEDQETEYNETFTFNKDGTGLYGFEDGGHWEYTFTYEWYDGDYVEIIYDDDGSVGGFTVRIEDDVMYVSNTAVVDMPLVRK